MIRRLLALLLLGNRVPREMVAIHAGGEYRIVKVTRWPTGVCTANVLHAVYIIPADDSTPINGSPFYWLQKDIIR
jgi:hypothetical protein